MLGDELLSIPLCYTAKKSRESEIYMDEVVSARIRWACRRGMLELDLLLQRFLETDYPSLSPSEVALFAALLTSPDPELLAWFMGYARCPNSSLRPMIERVRAAQ